MKQFRIMTNTGAFGLPWLVAEQEGLFAQVGLAVEIVPRDPNAPEREVFSRTKERSLEQGRVDLCSVCEWGALQRIAAGSRGRIWYVITANSSYAVVSRQPGLRAPRHLRHVPIGVKEYAGSHYATLAMLERHLPRAAIKAQHVGGPLLRLQQLLAGSMPAVTLMEHYIALAAFHGAHVVARDEFAEVALVRGDPNDEIPRLFFRAVREAIERINADGPRYRELLLADVPDEVKRGFSPPVRSYPMPEPFSPARFAKVRTWMQQRRFLSVPLAYEDMVLPRGGIDAPHSDS